jgi:hypothetical protein
MKLYSIANWEDHYETAETRKLVRLSWVPAKVKLMDLGLKRILAERDGLAILGCWSLLLQMAAAGRYKVRGKLTSAGSPLTCADMAFLVARRPAEFERAISFLSQPHIGWIVIEDAQSTLPLLPETPAESAAVAGDSAVGIEGKGREGNRMEEAAADAVSLPFTSEEFKAAWKTFEKHRSEIRKPLRPTSAKLQLKLLAAMGEQRAIRAIEHTVAKGWQGIREPDGSNGNRRRSEFADAF